MGAGSFDPPLFPGTENKGRRLGSPLKLLLLPSAKPAVLTVASSEPCTEARRTKSSRFVAQMEAIQISQEEKEPSAKMNGHHVHERCRAVQLWRVEPPQGSPGPALARPRPGTRVKVSLFGSGECGQARCGPDKTQNQIKAKMFRF